MPGGNCDIGYLYERNVLLALDDACFIANIAGLNQNHRVGVIIHNSLSYEQFSRNPYFLITVTETLGALLMKYPNIEFWFEITETDYIVNQQTYETMNLVHEILNNR